MRDVIFINHPCFTLQHPPSFTAFDAKEHHLTGDGIELHFPRFFRLNITAKVFNEAPVLFIKDAAMNNIILGDKKELFIQQHQTGRLGFLDRLDMLTEAPFGDRPMRDPKNIVLPGARIFGVPPVAIDTRVALEVEGFLRGFAAPGIEDKLRHAARIAD